MVTRQTTQPVLRRMCGTMECHHRLLEMDPSLRRRQMDLEQTTARRMTSRQPLREGITTIPVVVHVVYRTESENISDAQINSQIDSLNLDFRAQNPDRAKVPAVWGGPVSDVRIQFVLASESPAGNPTSGITRTRTRRTSFSTDDSVKKIRGARAWPSDKYLNIWICTLSGGLLGYAQFPGGPPETDGAVILNRAFGTTGTATVPFNLGRTTTHEIGHWLNLHHIWGDGFPSCSDSDYVSDTPNQEGPNYGKPSFPHISCNNGPNGDMFMDYMDYVDDDAMYLFTAQQSTRMHATLDGARSTIGTSV